MTVTVIDGLYQFREKDCKVINISEGLYDLIVGGYSKTNELFTGKNKRFPRTKSRQETVTKIGCQAFAGCDRLKTLRIPASVTHIDGSDLLFDCSDLESVEVSADNPHYYSRGTVLYSKADSSLVVRKYSSQSQVIQ